jgi:hypothetical protein
MVDKGKYPDPLGQYVGFMPGRHQQFVMRCGFLLVEGCMVTCLVFNSEDYSCVICWLFTKTMDCFSSIFFLSFQDFYTIVLDELVLEVAARHRDDDLAQPSDQDYNRGRT